MRVPIESLLLSARAGSSIFWVPTWARSFSGDEDQVVTLTMASLELGAAFRDAPAPGWRYELGMAMTIPTRFGVTADGIEPVPAHVRPLFQVLPPPEPQPTLGWDEAMYRADVIAWIPWGRVEWDPHPALALGLELRLPIVYRYERSEVLLMPQGRFEIAYRHERVVLTGIRVEVTYQRQANVLLEPFVRVMFDPHTFLRAAARLPLGPRFPFITEEPFGFLGGSLHGGVLF